MTYDPSRRPRHPVRVAELNDANIVSNFADYLQERMPELATHGAQSGTIHAIQLLRGTARAIRP